MKHREQQAEEKPMNHCWEDADDSRRKMERVDVSPFGTEGIFIDVDLAENINEK